MQESLNERSTFFGDFIIKCDWLKKTGHLKLRENKNIYLQMSTRMNKSVTSRFQKHATIISRSQSSHLTHAKVLCHVQADIKVLSNFRNKNFANHLSKKN